MEPYALRPLVSQLLSLSVVLPGSSHGHVCLVSMSSAHSVEVHAKPQSLQMPFTEPRSGFFPWPLASPLQGIPACPYARPEAQGAARVCSRAFPAPALLWSPAAPL